MANYTTDRTRFFKMQRMYSSIKWKVFASVARRRRRWTLESARVYDYAVNHMEHNTSPPTRGESDVWARALHLCEAWIIMLHTPEIFQSFTIISEYAPKVVHCSFTNPLWISTSSLCCRCTRTYIMCHGNRKSNVVLDVIDHRMRRMRTDGRADQFDAITLGSGRKGIPQLRNCSITRN